MKNRWVIIVVLMLLLGAISTVGSCGLQKPVEQPEETGWTIAEAEAYERRTFAITALFIWEGTNRVKLDTMELLLEKPTPVDYSTRTGALSFRLIDFENTLNLLYAPPDAIGIKNSLLVEIDLLQSCIPRVFAYFYFKEQGDKASASQYLGEVVEPLDRLPSKQIQRDLINLRLQAEKDLNLR